MAGERVRVFLGYSDAEREWAERIRRHLESLPGVELVHSARDADVVRTVGELLLLVRLPRGGRWEWMSLAERARALDDIARFLLQAANVLPAGARREAYFEDTGRFNITSPALPATHDLPDVAASPPPRGAQRVFPLPLGVLAFAVALLAAAGVLYFKMPPSPRATEAGAIHAPATIARDLGQ